MTKLDVSVSELTVAALTAVALIFCITFFNGANADSMSKSKYQSLKNNLITDYKAAKTRCDSLLGNAKASCNTKAEATKDIAKSELDASFTPTIQNQPDANTVKSGATEKDKTAKSDGFSYRSNPFITIEFNNIYHVKA